MGGCQTMASDYAVLMPYESSEDRMDRLEAVLASFVQQTNRALEMRDQMLRGLDEAGHARNKADHARDKALGELDQRLADFSRRVDQDILEMRQWRIQSQKQWGEIANKLGTFVEDIVAPNIPRIGKEIFGLNGQPQEMFSAARLRLSHPQDPARMREFDYIYAARLGWIVVESKNDPKLKDVDAFRELLAEVKDYFPQYSALPLYP